MTTCPHNRGDLLQIIGSTFLWHDHDRRAVWHIASGVSPVHAFIIKKDELVIFLQYDYNNQIALAEVLTTDHHRGWIDINNLRLV